MGISNLPHRAPDYVARVEGATSAPDGRTHSESSSHGVPPWTADLDNNALGLLKFCAREGAYRLSLLSFIVNKEASMTTSNWAAPDVATIKTSDRITLWVIAAALIAFGLYGLSKGAMRIIELVGSDAVRVELDLSNTPLPPLPAEATAAEVTVHSIDPSTRAFLVIEQVFASLGWIAFYALVAVFLVQVARRIAFGRRMPILLMTAAFALLIGQGVSLQMHVAAATNISDTLGLDLAFTFDPLTILVLPILLVAFAFVLGAGKRIEKDTEGLV